MGKHQARNENRISSVLWEVSCVMLASILLALLVNQGRGDGLPLIADWSPEGRLTAGSGESLIISLEEAKDLCADKSAVFLDARPPERYTEGHIRCALNVPWQHFEAYVDRVWDKIAEDAWIVTYCDGETCSLSEDLARELISMGYENVRVLLNGWTRWRSAGFPIEDGRSVFYDNHRGLTIEKEDTWPIESVPRGCYFSVSLGGLRFRDDEISWKGFKNG